MWDAILKAAGSAAIAYSTHYGVTKLYSNFCVPDGFWGYLQGAVTAGSPVCQAGVQVMQHTQMSYSTLIMMGATRLFLDALFPGAGAGAGATAAAAAAGPVCTVAAAAAGGVGC
jgi:hypothetical protein